jgi:hypothetical protein
MNISPSFFLINLRMKNTYGLKYILSKLALFFINHKIITLTYGQKIEQLISIQSN